MKRNPVLQLALLVIRVYIILYISFYILFLGLFIYWHINPGAFDKVDISSGYKAGISIRDIRLVSSERSPDMIVLSEVSHPMFYWLFLRMTFFFLLGFLILQRLKRVIRSIHSLNTFYEGNIRHFKSIGFLFLIMAALGFFNYYSDGTVSRLQLTIPFTPLLLGMAGFVMAEVFAEGKSLTEDKNLIV